MDDKDHDPVDVSAELYEDVQSGSYADALKSAKVLDAIFKSYGAFTGDAAANIEEAYEILKERNMLRENGLGNVLQKLMHSSTQKRCAVHTQRDTANETEYKQLPSQGFQELAMSSCSGTFDPTRMRGTAILDSMPPTSISVDSSFFS